MEGDLRGGIAVPGEDMALQVRHQQHLGRHPSLADPGGGDENPVAFQPHREIAVVGGHISPVVQELSHLAQLLAHLLQLVHSTASFSLLV
jgi:hypothetical protein